MKALFRREPPTFEGGGRRRQLIVKPSAQARRMRLAVDPRDGSVRLTLPKRASLRAALDWAEERRGWIETELNRLPNATPIMAGGTILLEGRPVLVDWRAGASRTIRRETDRIVLGGAIEAVSNRVIRWLKREALVLLDRETREIAAVAGVTIGKVGIGDPKGRWGSCSSNGDIRYSWRLILAPPDVRRATVAHEVAHRLHMDHSPAFHAAVARLFGRDPAAERRWLRQHGSGLHWIGQEG
jgi:predicted metal-dependent hydrolase